MNVAVYRDETGFDDLAQEWDELLYSSSADTIFLSYAWQTTWWRHLGEGQLTILTVRDAENALVGLAPLFCVRRDVQRVMSTLGCVDVSDYLDWIAQRGLEAQVFSALMETLGRELRGEWDELILCNIPSGSPTLELLPDLAHRLECQVVRTVDDVAPMFGLPRTWEEYEQMLPGKARRELRRKLRKAGPFSGVDWYIVGSEQDLQPEIDAFIDLLVLSHPDKAGFMDDRTRAFFHAIGHAAFISGYLQLAFLTLNGRRVATCMNFRYRDRVMVYNSGLDPATYAISPGIVLVAHLIRTAIEDEQINVFDFLRGDEPYKYQLGGADAQVYRLTIKKN